MLSSLIYNRELNGKPLDLITYAERLIELKHFFFCQWKYGLIYKCLSISNQNV